MAHLHNVRDSDANFAINPTTMEIVNNGAKTKLMQGDCNSEIFTIEIPKEIEGHDMRLCNVIRVHYINISSDKLEKSKGVYEVAEIDEEAGMLIFGWLVSGNATKHAGILSFRIEFACVGENSLRTYVKWTDVFSEITVCKGFDNGESVVEEYADILEQWKKELSEEVSTVIPVSLYLCSDEEYADGIPTIENPEEDTLYLVPISEGEEDVDQYAGWVYLGNEWAFVETLYITLEEDVEGGNGLSAYEIAVKNGFMGTEQEWLQSLKGSQIIKTTIAIYPYIGGFIGGVKIEYRMSLSNVLSETGVSVVKAGDIIWNSYYHYPVLRVDETYIYLGAYTNIRGATGATGATGKTGANGKDGYTPEKGVDYFTEADKTEIINAIYEQIADGNEVAY